MADSESHEPSPHLKQEARCKVCASCAMGRELHASSHHTSQCRRVTAFGGTRMDVILHLNLQMVKCPVWGPECRLLVLFIAKLCL